MKTLLYFKELFLKIWNDSVWSKVIAGGILAAIPIAWLILSNYWHEIYCITKKVLCFNLPLYVFICIVALYYIVKKVVQIFKKKKDSFWDEQMGNYTFQELYNILLTERMTVQTRGMEMIGKKAPTHNMLFLFDFYYIILNSGIGFEDDIDDEGYLYGVLAPRLLGFGLVDEYQKQANNLPDKTYIAYKTSSLGHRFHSILDILLFKEKQKSKK